MCVIIFIPNGQRINQAELEDAWTTNPDGAGYAYNKGGRTVFKRGFMNKKFYVQRVMQLQEELDGGILLHLRISTGAGVTPQGTHPYKVGNVLKMKGATTAPVYAMNGIILEEALQSVDGQKLNDTASYIKRHAEALRTPSADLLNILEEATGAKWAAVTGEGVLLSPGFTESEGLYYSNTNHLHRWSSTYFEGYYVDTFENSLTAEDFLTPALTKKVRKNYGLLCEVEDYVYFMCRHWNCDRCNGCICEIETLQELRQFLKNNGGY